MAFYINDVRLMGFIGSVQAPADNSPLKFSLATTRNWRDANKDLQEETDWHTVAVWQPPEKLLGKLAKGARCYVEGRLSVQEFEHEGAARRSVEIVAPARRVEIVAPPRNRSAPPG